MCPGERDEGGGGKPTGGAQEPVIQGELAQIAALDGTKVLYLGRHEGRAPLRLSATIGDRFPASITAVMTRPASRAPAGEGNSGARR